MEWTEYSVITPALAVEAVAALFHRLGCGGVLIEEAQPPYQLQLADRDEAAAPLVGGPDHCKVKAYFHADDQLTPSIESGLELVMGLFSCTCRLQTALVQDEDWADSWKEHFKTFRVGEHLVIKPAWLEYEAHEGDVIIQVDPGMAFGTGLHASTRFCLQFMDEYIKGGEKVVDAGCGSGILAVAAAKLGATKILAIDNDIVAVKVAEQNKVLNGLGEQIKVSCGDIFIDLGQQQADIITANLTADIIIGWLPVAVDILRRPGYLFASGIQDQRWPEVKQALEKAGFHIAQVALEEDWVGVVAYQQ